MSRLEILNARTYRDFAVKIAGRELRQCAKVSVYTHILSERERMDVKDVKERIMWESDVHSLDDNTAI